MFQCNNGKCISKYYICNSRDDCGDNSDESKTTVAFFGMLLDTFVSLSEIFCLTYYDSLNYVKKKREFVKSGFEKKVQEDFFS